MVFWKLNGVKLSGMKTFLKSKENLPPGQTELAGGRLRLFVSLLHGEASQMEGRGIYRAARLPSCNGKIKSMQPLNWQPMLSKEKKRKENQDAFS